MKHRECWIKDSRDFFAVGVVKAFNVLINYCDSSRRKTLPNLLD